MGWRTAGQNLSIKRMIGKIDRAQGMERLTVVGALRLLGQLRRDLNLMLEDKPVLPSTPYEIHAIGYWSVEP